MVTHTWHASKYKVHRTHQKYMNATKVAVALVEFMYLVFTRTPS